MADDKLIALSGLAKDMQNCLNDRYLAGLWERNLAADMMWCIQECKQEDGSPSVRPTGYRALMVPGICRRAHQLLEDVENGDPHDND
jgi:hypothetical protein